MPRLRDAIGNEEGFKEAYDKILPVITLYGHPRKKRFQEIRLHLQGRDYWPRKTGDVFAVRIRNRTRFRARLMSCVFKSMANLETQDALAAGFNGTGPLTNLRAYLKKKWKENPQWRGEKTELYILTFEKV